jgi:hypothetical protein
VPAAYPKPDRRGYALDRVEQRQPQHRSRKQRRGCEPKRPRGCDCWACTLSDPPSVDAAAVQYPRPGDPAEADRRREYALQRGRAMRAAKRLAAGAPGGGA